MVNKETAGVFLFVLVIILKALLDSTLWIHN